MNSLKSAILLNLLTSTVGLSPGTQLASFVQNTFRNVTKTTDLCILHDSPSWIWIDLLDDFNSKLAGNFAVNRLEWFGNTGRSCDFHLILLDSGWELRDFGKMVDRFLDARNWNRFGRFVFVTIEDENFSLNILERYVDFVLDLGITKSVTILIRKDGSIPLKMHFNYFSLQETFFEDFEAIEIVFQRDALEDLKGHPFSTDNRRSG